MFWYPWGQEAIDKAQAEDKPILVSIGYSTCYWCHVMEREVFENPSIAAIMNAHFINVKIDREEHPHLDDTYMAARQLLTREGGWPNNVFVTPELKPFYACGTLGPTSQQGRMAFPDLLRAIEKGWQESREDIEKDANNLYGLMQQMLGSMRKESSAISAKALLHKLTEYHDPSAGGFFSAPKFPHETYLYFLLTYYERTQEIEALNLVTHSLNHMAAGGIYDHVGGGFHRYAVDKEWWVPHFEKMLYNQALCARLYARHASITGSAYSADIARSILDMVRGPLSTEEGLFYSAFDAETHGIEGAYYSWTEEEVRQLLLPEEQALFVSIYALVEIPHFPGHKAPTGKALIARQPLTTIAQERGVEYTLLAKQCYILMNKLLEVRNKRQSPRLDNKVIAAWNGLMIGAYAEAGQLLSEEKYITRATHAANALMQYCVQDQVFYRIYTNGQPEHPATLEDYAYVIQGLLLLYNASQQPTWLEKASDLMQLAIKTLWDNEHGGFYLTQKESLQPIRVKNCEDGALPCPNAVMLDNMLTLADNIQDSDWQDYANRQRLFVTAQINPKALPEYATAIATLLSHKQGADSITDILMDKQQGDITIKASAYVFPPDFTPPHAIEIHMDIHIPTGWHIIAPGNPDHFGTKLDITVNAPGLDNVVLELPEVNRLDGREGMHAPKIYKDKIHIIAKAQARKALKDNELSITCHYQLCSEGLCHTPATIIIQP